MLDKKEIMKKNKTVIILIVIMLIKIAIVQVQPINAKYTMKYDDQLMINMANSIIEGKWLGEYKSFTLIKGVFTPLFIVIMYLLKIPFLIGKEIFYGIACITFILVISKKIRKKIILLLIYLIILFNPVEYSTEICRIYRDGIYMSLILYLLSFSMGIFLNRKESIKKQIKYFVSLGLTLSAIYLCREETIWLFPFLLIIGIFTILSIIIDSNLQNRKNRILLFFIPIVITVIFINIICLINYKYYGIYTLNQYWGTSFKKAYGALTRVIPEKEIKRVPVTSETMKRIYEISPKFRELKEFFEGEGGKKWQECGQHIDGEINGGYFHWALMNAVEQKGYYKDAKSANKYYEELANEINEACDKEIIEGRKKTRISNTCYFDIEDIIDVLKKIKQTIKYQYSLQKVEIAVNNQSTILGIENEEKIKSMFEKITNQEIVTIEYYNKTINNIRLKILETINNIYMKLNIYVFYFSILCFVIFIISSIKEMRKYYEEYVILISLFVIYITRIFIITFTSELMFLEAKNVSYLSSVYNIQYLFAIFSIIFLVTKSTQKIKNKWEKNKYGRRFNNINTSTK